MIDYEQLLIKYMSLVLDIEGTTALYYADSPDFSDEELKELEEIQKKAINLSEGR